MRDWTSWEMTSDHHWKCMMNWVGTKTIKHFVVITRCILFIEIYKGGLLTRREHGTLQTWHIIWFMVRLSIL